MTAILRINDVVKITSMSNSTIYELIKSHDFPRPKRLGKRAVGWLQDDIEDWINTRPKGGSWNLHDDEKL